MDTGLTFKKIDDLDAVNHILTDGDMWDRISEDGQSKEDFGVPYSPVFWWVGVYDGDKCIGMYFLHALNCTSAQIHAHIIEEHRDKFAYKAGAGIIRYFVEETGFKKLIAEIPFKYENVYHYTKKFGFVDEGVNRESYSKDGIVIDQWRLGLTLEEAERWLRQQ